MYARFHIMESIASKRMCSHLETLFLIEREPFVIIECSRQNNSIKSTIVDVRTEFDCKENVPANTTAYCLIIYDRVAQYNLLINVVRKIM